MKIIKYTWSEIEGACADVCRQMQKDAWMPDYIVGITRGGLIPSTLISHYLSVPLHTLSVSLRDQVQVESNLWMAEDAFGYVKDGYSSGTQTDPFLRKKILIVDDINDTGETLKWIQQDWPESCLPKHYAWETIWNHNVKFCTIVNNTTSAFKNMDYSFFDINKAEDPCWIQFPWEEWWI